MNTIFLILNASAGNAGNNSGISVIVAIIIAIASCGLGYILGTALKNKRKGEDNAIDARKYEEKEKECSDVKIMNLKMANAIAEIKKKMPNFNELNEVDGEELMEFIGACFVESDNGIRDYCKINPDHFNELKEKIKSNQEQARKVIEIRDLLRQQYRDFTRDIENLSPNHLTQQNEADIINKFFDMIVIYLDCINKEYNETRFVEINDGNKDYLNIMLIKGFVDKDRVINNAREVSVVVGESPIVMQLLNRILSKFILKPIVISGWKIRPQN